MSDWYYDINGQASAPVTKAMLGQMLASGQINRQTQVIRDGIQWTPLEDVAELRDILPAAPAQSYSPSGGVSIDLVGTKWEESAFSPPHTYKFKKSGVLHLSHFESGYDFNQTKKGTWTQNGSSVTIDLDGKHYELQFTDADKMEGTYCYPKTTIGNPNEGYETRFFRKKGLFG